MSDWNLQFKHPIDYLLLESGDKLLRENGDKVVLEQTGRSATAWTQPTKN